MRKASILITITWISSIVTNQPCCIPVSSYVGACVERMHCVLVSAGNRTRSGSGRSSSPDYTPGNTWRSSGLKHAQTDKRQISYPICNLMLKVPTTHKYVLQKLKHRQSDIQCVYLNHRITELFSPCRLDPNMGLILNPNCACLQSISCLHLIGTVSWFVRSDHSFKITGKFIEIYNDLPSNCTPWAKWVNSRWSCTRPALEGMKWEASQKGQWTLRQLQVGMSHLVRLMVQLGPRNVGWSFWNRKAPVFHKTSLVKCVCNTQCYWLLPM